MTQDLNLLIEKNAQMLQPSLPFAKAAPLLKAIARVESSFGCFNIPKYERAFDFNGAYFNNEQRERWLKWGAWAACSYSSFQIMYTSAAELGFDKAPWNRSPADLMDDAVAIIWVIELIKKRILSKGAQDIRQVFDAYNSGTFKDLIIPHEYIEKATKFYHEYNGAVQA